MQNKSIHPARFHVSLPVIKMHRNSECDLHNYQQDWALQQTLKAMEEIVSLIIKEDTSRTKECKFLKNKNNTNFHSTSIDDTNYRCTSNIIPFPKIWRIRSKHQHRHASRAFFQNKERMQKMFELINRISSRSRSLRNAYKYSVWQLVINVHDMRHYRHDCTDHK